MKRRTNEELLGLIAHQMTRAADYSTTTVQEYRRKAWDAYLNRPRGDEMAGRSQIQDTTIRDTHLALMSTIAPAFVTDHVIAFPPSGPGDEEQADAEAEAINALFTEDNSGYMELCNAISDCLLFRNGVIKVWIDRGIDTTVQRYNAPAADVAAMLALEGVEDARIEETDGVTTASWQTETQELKAKCIEQAYFRCDPNWHSLDLSDCPYIEERAIFTRQELRDMGISKRKIDECSQMTDESTSTAPSQTNTDVVAKFVDGQPTHTYTSAWSEQRVECQWVHMLVDGERWKFLVHGSKVLLDKEPVGFWPYAAGAAVIVPHRWSGLGLYDLLAETQHAKTGIKRQMLDSMNYSNNPGLVYDPSSTKEQDVKTRAPGRGIRSTTPERVLPIPVTDLTGNSLSALQYFDSVASQQSGAALQMVSETNQLAQISGVSAEIQMAPFEQVAAQMSRTISQSLVANTFLLMHRVLREEYDGTLMYRKLDEWIETNPGEWRPRTKINVTVGQSPGERRRHRAALEQTLQYQMTLIQGGAANIATDWSGIYAALTDWMKAAELDGTEGYFVHPDSQQAQEAMQAGAMAQQQQSEQMNALQQIQIQLEQQAQQLEKYKHDTDLQFKYWAEEQENERKEAELVADGIQAEISRADSGGPGEAGNTRNGQERGD